MEVSQKLKIEVPISPLGIHLKEKKKNPLIRKDTCTLKFTAAIFTTAKKCKQLKCPSIDEWIKKDMKGEESRW